MGGNAVVPPAGQFILQKGIWFKVIEWGGITVETITYKVISQSEFRGWKKEWRRYGVSWVPYWSGEFTEEESFHIYPGDLYLRVDIRSPDFDVGINVERSSEK